MIGKPYLFKKQYHDFLFRQLCPEVSSRLRRGQTSEAFFVLFSRILFNIK